MGDATAVHRERVWRELREVARPDSRFHWDFSAFIADFDGSDAATERVRALEAWQKADTVVITPDNSTGARLMRTRGVVRYQSALRTARRRRARATLARAADQLLNAQSWPTELLRRAAIEDGKTQLVTTYGIRRGFYELRAEWVPPGQAAYAATLDGLDRLGRPVTLAKLRGGRPLALLITGGSAVSRNGVRFGKGHGYFDIEWGMLSEIGLTDAATQVVDIVHDCQYVDEVLQGELHDVAVDWVITATRTIAVPDPQRAPGKVHWDLLPGTEHEHLPPIEELRAWRAGAQ